MLSKIIPLALLLSACGAAHVEPVPVQHVYCLTPEQFKAVVDKMPAKIGNQLDHDARIANKQLITQNILVRAYANDLLTVLGGCTGNPN